MPSVALTSIGSTLTNMQFAVGRQQHTGFIYPSNISDLNANRIIKCWEVFFFVNSKTTEMTMLVGNQTLSTTYVRWGPTQALGQPGFLIDTCIRDFSNLSITPITIRVPYDPELNVWHHLVVRRSDVTDRTTVYVGRRGVDINGLVATKDVFPYGQGLDNGVSRSLFTSTGGASMVSLFAIDGFQLPRARVAIGADYNGTSFQGNHWKGGICELRAWHKDLSNLEIEGNAGRFVHDAGVANPGAGSVAYPSQDLIHCWRLNEATTGSINFEDVGNYAVQTIGTTNSQAFNVQNTVPLQFTGFPSHPFVIPAPVGEDIPVSGNAESRPDVDIGGSFAQFRRPNAQPSSRPRVTAFVSLDDLRFVEAEVDPEVEALAAKDFAPPTLDDPSAEPSANVSAQLLQSFIRQGDSVLNPRVEAPFNWDRGIEPDEPSMEPSVTTQATAEKTVTTDTPSAEPAVVGNQVADRPVSGTASLRPHMQADFALGDAVTAQPNANPAVAADFNLDQVESLTASAEPDIEVTAQLSTLITISGNPRARPGVVVGESVEFPLTLLPSSDPAVAAAVSLDAVQSAEVSLAPDVSMVLTTELSVDVSADPDVAAQAMVNTFVIQGVTASAEPEVLAVVAQCFAVAGTASAAPGGSAASGTIGAVEPDPVEAEASPAVSAIIGFDIGIELIIKEGTGIIGTPVTPEALVAVVDIWNAALVRLGAACITSTSDTTNEAVKISCVWDEFRTQFLAEHSWNGAKKTVALSQFFNNDGTTVVTPPNRWRFTYELPVDYIKALTLGGLSNEPRSDIIWEIESRANDITTKRVMHTNVEPNSEGIELEYIFDVGTNVALLGAKTRWAMSRALAWTAAENFGKSTEDIVQLESEAKKAMAAAKGIDGQEQTALFFAETGLSAVRDRDRFGFGSGSRGFR